MDHFYRFARVTNQVPVQGFLDTESAIRNLLMDLVNPGNKQNLVQLCSVS
ncbi:hypothetical protein Hanom_Chr05g00411381 [Helianthus anomalus]